MTHSTLNGRAIAAMPTVNPYRQEVLKIIESVVRPLSPLENVLDFGAGDGFFAEQFRRQGLAHRTVAAEVMQRPDAFCEPVVYDGRRLPFSDGSFDLVYSVDVIHHCPDPRASLRDLLRCSRRYFLIKDHNYRTFASKVLLCCLDEIGNRRFGVPCLYKHQRHWEWHGWIEAEGFELVELIHPAECHPRPHERFINRYEYVALWQRKAMAEQRLCG